MTKKMWKLISEENIDGDTSIKTLRKDVKGGFIYMMLISTAAGITTESLYVPDVEKSALEMEKHFPEMISGVKQKINKIESDNWHKGEYKAGLIPDWLEEPKKPKTRKFSKYPKKLPPELPDYLPEDL